MLYGVQTLRQLIDGDRVPIVEIRDEPHFGYRGAMFDVARYFYPVEDVKRFIDILALHKLNTFHWHLTDDQGWRIEIKRYPELTRIGSQRRETLIGHYKTSKEYDGTPHGGYYTQDEIREVVAYAAERCIDVIPEIRASRTFDGGPGVVSVAGVHERSLRGAHDVVLQQRRALRRPRNDLRISRKRAYGGARTLSVEIHPRRRRRMSQNAVESVVPTAASHAPGGAEGRERPSKLFRVPHREVAPRPRPRNDRLGRTARRRRHALDDRHVVARRGRRHRGREARQPGHHVPAVLFLPRLLPDLPTRRRTANRSRSAATSRSANSTATIPSTGSTRRKAAISSGIQANLWTEYIATMDHAEYMLLPRLAAMSEVAWATERRDYDDFVRRLGTLRGLYDREGYRYADFVFRGIE